LSAAPTESSNKFEERCGGASMMPKFSNTNFFQAILPNTFSRPYFQTGSLGHYPASSELRDCTSFINPIFQHFLKLHQQSRLVRLNFIDPGKSEARLRDRRLPSEFDALAQPAFC